MKRCNRWMAAGMALMLAVPLYGCGGPGEKGVADEVITLRILENDTAKEKGILMN